MIGQRYEKKIMVISAKLTKKAKKTLRLSSDRPISYTPDITLAQHCQEILGDGEDVARLSLTFHVFSLTVSFPSLVTPGSTYTLPSKDNISFSFSSTTTVPSIHTHS